MRHTDKRIDSPFDGPVCDFCLASGPRWSYDPKDSSLAAQVITVPGVGETTYFPGTSPWAACTRCAVIFDRGDLETLSRVCAQSAARRLAEIGVPPPDLEEDIARLRVLHAELKAGLKPRRRASAQDHTSHARGATIKQSQRQNVEGN